MQEKPAVDLVSVLVDVVHAAGIEARRAPLDAVDFGSAVEKELGEVGTVLAGNTGN